MVNIQRYCAEAVWDPPNYSQATKVSGAETLLYISGQVAYDDKGGTRHPSDFAAQARAALSNLKAQVEAGGGTLDNVVKVNTYLTDMRYRAEFGTIREEFFGKKMPSHTLVAVTALA